MEVATRFWLTVGAAAGGLLAAASLSVGVAAADDSYTLVPQTDEVVTGISGFPPLYEDTVGTAVFGADQGNPFVTLGTFDAEVKHPDDIVRVQ
jgi:hypothetical protein